MINKVIVALDNMTLKEAKQFLDTTDDIKIIKIGMEMFYSNGREALLELHQKYGVKIFLDLKLHDIPNTVAKAIKSLSGLPIEFLTIHTVGGSSMIEAAMDAKKEFLPETNLLGVSYLTSLSESHFKEILNVDKENIKAAFNRIFKAGLDKNIDGFILSGHELKQLNELCISENKMALKVCPGIRFNDEINLGKLQDQKRVMSPTLAFNAGADFLVMGRSITQANNLSKRLAELKSISS
jgi:orotidine-5'-phosphate decarboxylase